MNLELLKHQYEFIADDQTRYLALVAGYGSGKTYAFCVKTIFMAAANVGYAGAIMEPTYGMIKRTLLPAMNEALQDLNIPYSFSKSDAVYTLHFAEGDCIVYCLSGENYSRMAGMNLAFFGVDECDTIQKDIARSMWNMAMSRLRSGRVYQGFTTSTPEGFNFLYEFFVDEAEGKTDRRLIKGRTQDNPFLPDDFIQSLLDNYPPNLIKSYLEGEFTNLTSGQIYYAFNREQNHTDDTLKDYPNHILHIGMDFNNQHMAGIVHVINNGVPSALDELIDLRNTEAIIQEIRNRYGSRKIIIYPDAAGNQNKSSASMSDIALLKQAGFEINVGSINPPVKDRINSMNGMFCNSTGVRKYKVNTKQCPKYTKTLEQQVYVNGVPHKAHDLDHPNDASGYFIYKIFPLQGRPTARVY